jgi:tellurite methyltransferase
MDSKMKWNHKYHILLSEQNRLEPNRRLKNLAPYLNGGVALDIACGLGGNSLFLAQNHYQVHAIDISDVAIDSLKDSEYANKQQIIPLQFNLEEWDKLSFKEGYLDLIVMTYYLNRSIFAYIKSVIKDDGYFFMETFYMSSLHDNQHVSDRYKLHSKELLTEFCDWKILFYEENEYEGRQTIFCQKNQ